MSLEDDMCRAIQAISDMSHPMNQPHPCKLGRHLVSPAMKERGYGVCGVCGSPVGEWPASAEDDA
jgi:RNA polymerase-binding transcription factor DksA